MTMNVTEAIRKMMGWCPLMSMKNTIVDSGMAYAHAEGMKGGGAPSNKTTVYEEKAPYSNTIKLVMAGGLFVLVILYFIAGFEKAPEQAVSALFFIVIMSAIITWGFFNIKFRITNYGVEAVMPPFKYSVPFSEIKEIRTIEDIPWYAGWGLRILGRRLAFISMRKNALLVVKERGFFRELVLTTRDPEEFIKKLKEEMR